MIVPNYVPEPLEVPANVTLEPYARRLRFIRRVTLRHALVVALVAALAATDAAGEIEAFFGPWLSVGLLLALLVALDLVRIARRGTAMEARASAAAIPVLLPFAAVALRTLHDLGVPVSAAAFGYACAGLYTFACGRDYSFVGNGAISLLASSVAVAIWFAEGVPLALLVNAAVLVYHVYDLASLLSRRRTGEEWAAALDLFRDVFNVFGWILRVARHWRAHRIWADLPLPERPSRP